MGVPIEADDKLRKMRERKTALKEERQERVLAHVRNGMTEAQAATAEGLSPTTVVGWRYRDPEYNKRLKAAIAERPDVLTDEEGKESDFVKFRLLYFGHHTLRWQVKAVEMLESADPMAFSMILVHPGAGKTMLLTDWICFKLALDPDFRIIIVSKSQNAARKIVEHVTRRMTDEGMEPMIRAYQEKYGPFRPPRSSGKPWKADYFTVVKSQHDEKDYSLQSLGWKGQVYGARADLIIFDDIQTIDSLNDTEKMLDKLRQEFGTRFGKDASPLVYIGTRLAPQDLAGKLIEDGDITPGRLVEFPAVDPVTEKGWDPATQTWEHVDVLCPELYSSEMYGKIRGRVKEKAWATAFMMRPEEDGDATFSPEMIEGAWDYRITSRGTDRIKLLAIDPALGGGCAFSLAEYDQNEFTLLTCRVYYGLSRTEDILDILARMTAEYRISDLIVERNALQKGIVRDERLRQLARMGGFKVREHETGRNKHDPVFGVSMMAGSMMRGEVRLAGAEERDRDNFKIFVKEALAWRPGIATRYLRQDAVMATWMAWKFWQERRAALGVDINPFRYNTGIGRPTPYTPIAPLVLK